MGLEIERKFLLTDDSWKDDATGLLQITQFYLSTDPVVRVRLEGDKAYMTVKGKTDDKGVSRNEWEFEIPYIEATQMFAVSDQRFITKRRWLVPVDKKVYEIDEFEGDNKGLTVAEIELKFPNEHFEKPEWLGEEVTGQTKYYNSELLNNPYKNW